MKRRQILILLAHTTSLPARSQAPTLTADTCSSRLLLLSVPGRNGVPVSLVHQLVNHADDCQSTDAIVKRRRVFLSPKASVGKTRPPLNSGLALALGYLPRTLPFSSCAQKRLRVWDRAHHVRVLQSYVRLKHYNCVVKKKKYKFHFNYCSAFQHINAHFLHASVYTTDLPQPQPTLPGITHVLLFFSVMML